MPDGDRQESNPRKGRIKDARGRKVTQLDPVALHLLQRNEPIERATLLKIVGEKGIRLSKLEIGSLIAVLVLIVALCIVLTCKHLAGEPWGALLKRATPTFYMLILPFTIWGGIRKKRFNMLAAAMLKHCCCPHCGYDIRALPADPADGATVCPECGYAWLLNKPKSIEEAHSQVE